MSKSRVLIVIAFFVLSVYGARRHNRAHHPVKHSAHKSDRHYSTAHHAPAHHPSASHHSVHHSKAHQAARRPTRKSQKSRAIRRTETLYTPFKDSINVTAHPCNDFYEFTCGTFVRQNPNGGADGRASRMNHIGDIAKQLRDDLIMNNDTNTLQAVKKLRQYRDKCMDVATIERGGEARTQQLRTDLTANGPFPLFDTAPFVANNFDVTVLTSMLTGISKRVSHPLLFDVDVFRMSDDKIYLILTPAQLIMKNFTNYADANERQKVHDFLVDILSIVLTDGRSTKTFNDIVTAVDAVLTFEQQIATIVTNAKIWPIDPLQFEQNADKIARADLDTLVGMINWSNFFANNDQFPLPIKAVLNDPTAEFYILNRAVFTSIQTLLNDNNQKEALANYLQIRFILHNLKFLDQRFINEAHRFAEKIDGSQYVSTRQQDCADDIAESFNLAVDHLFVSNYFPQKHKEMVEQLVEDVRKGLADTFNADTWISKDSRAALLQKLAKMKKVVGAVNDAVDSRHLEQRYQDLQLNSSADSYRSMAVKVALWKKHRELLSLIVPDYLTSLEKMPSTDMNAMHIRDENTIFIPAAITYLIDTAQSHSYNYGNLGFVLGHELTHGFDSNGALYDEFGLSGKDLLDNATRSAFNARTQCFIQEYNTIEDPKLKIKVDGARTLAENISDHGGVRAAFNAYKEYLKRNNNRDGHVRGYAHLTPAQTFFISMGVAFCDAYNDKYRDYLLRTDNHAPNFARINEVLANYPEFAKAFKCPRGSRMNPMKKCDIW
ncbi:Phosphate-regulating neutral endopeptidase [Aphelenchoides besseyi]|nr:Phosphate-regulating neutral endopeptidase [Aphelenchoides besseyi]KAI6199232.1 Phosphate-regulating neutral endopeptidase [Aphelenchoides besseyi]